MQKPSKMIAFSLLVILMLIILPFILQKDAEFGGSDDAGSQMVSQIRGEEFEPWFTPVMEQALGRELPGEIESLLFCLQTAIGTAVIAFAFGYLVARSKYSKQEETTQDETVQE